MKTRAQVISDINGLATAVFDNGRRGQPRPGCDCEQCFGYCLIDRDGAARSASGLAFSGQDNTPRGIRPLDFS